MNLAGPVVAPGTLARRRQPVIELEDLVLRPWQASDAPAVAEAYSDPDIQRWHVRSMTIREAEAWARSWPARWEREDAASWAISADLALLGQIGLRQLNLPDAIANVSYWVMPAARGRRIATRALCALTAWVFDRAGLHRLELQHSTSNLASCHVATNAGFQLEGVKRQEGLHRDGWHDMHLHARLDCDPQPADSRGSTAGQPG